MEIVTQFPAQVNNFFAGFFGFFLRLAAFSVAKVGENVYDEKQT